MRLKNYSAEAFIPPQSSSGHMTLSDGHIPNLASDLALKVTLAQIAHDWK